MGVVLTNSYKGLIISYLSAPWAPKQDWNYFHEMKDFQFYSPYSKSNDHFWGSCALFKRHLNYGKSCNDYDQLVLPFSSFAFEVRFNLVFGDYVSRNYSDIFTKRVLVFPPNESFRVNTALIAGSKVAIAGFSVGIFAIFGTFFVCQWQKTVFNGF